MADTALITADAGYLTRRLVDVAQDITIFIDDCKTSKGLLLEDLKDGEEIVEALEERVYGRYTFEKIIDPVTNKTICQKNKLITEDIIEKIAKSSVIQIKVRSTLTCMSDRGVCAKCYGINLAINEEVKLGDAVGIMAAQSIGEPGTQLTLRTFHIGGTASRIVEQSQRFTKLAGKI